MNKKSSGGFVGRYLWLGIGLGVLFWILETVIHLSIFHKFSMWEDLLRPSGHELWMQLLVFSLFVAYGAFIQRAVNRREEAEKALQDLNATLEQKIQDRTIEIEHQAEELLRTNAELEEEIEKRIAAEKSFQDAGQELWERVKEFSCLYECFDILSTREEADLDDMLRNVVKTIPRGFRYSNAACAKIVLDGREYESGNYAEPVEKMEKELSIHGKLSGRLVVGYVEHRPEAESGPFLRAEKELLNVLAQRIQATVEGMNAWKWLQQSRAKFRALFDSVGDAIFVIEPDGRYLNINDGACERLGYTRDELLQMGPRDINPAENIELVETRIEEVLQKGRIRFETEHMAKDGTLIPTEISARLINYEDRNAILAVARDISERKRAEAILKNRLEWEGLIALVSKSFISLPPDKIDEAITLALGKIGAKAGVDRCYVFMFDEGAESVSNTHEWCVEGISPQIHNLQHIPLHSLRWWIRELQDKDKIHIPDVDDLPPEAQTEKEMLKAQDIKSVAVVPIVWGGRIKGFLGFDSVRDHTTWHAEDFQILNTVSGLLMNALDRKASDAALRESETRYRRLVESLDHGICELDTENRIKYANPRLAEILGYTQQEMLGREIFSFMDDRGIEIWERNFGREHDGKHDEFEFIHKNGNKVFARMYVSLVYDSEGQYTGALAGVTDITERKTLESQLLQAQKLESIGQLAAGIAHEINTPTQYVGDNIKFLSDAGEDLFKILGECQVLLDAAKQGDRVDELVQRVEDAKEKYDFEYLQEEIPKAIDQSLDGVKRISKIVGSMRQFAHPGPSEKASINLNGAIESTVTVARNEWKYVSDLKLDLDEDLPPVPCVAGEINQVMLNLIINAAHAIADKIGDGSNEKGLITVSTRRVGDWAEIRVRDTGTGIPQKNQSRIFDPFFTTKQVGKGTGQGLAIARTVIVEKHGGEMTFESKEGQGTTFIVRLPLEQ